MIAHLRFATILLLVIGFLMLVNGNVYPQIGDQSRGGKVFKTRILSFTGPTGLKFEPFVGEDSEVWLYKGSGLKLKIEFGMYSHEDPFDRNEEDYRRQTRIIDGKMASLVFFKYKRPDAEGFDYVAAAYFADVGDPRSTLSLVASCRTTNEQNVAEKIFRSIKFQKYKAKRQKTGRRRSNAASLTLKGQIQ